MVEPYRVAGEVEQVQAMLFATREAFEAATFATAMMGQTYVEPDFANEHIVGLVAPVAPIGTKLTVKAASFADGVITLATELSKAEAGEGDLEIRPSYVVAIPKHEGARSIVVTVNGETIAELPLQ